MKHAELLELAALLRQFFKEYRSKFNSKDFAWRNPVAECLKSELIGLGRWKELPRGKPGEPPFKRRE